MYKLLSGTLFLFLVLWAPALMAQKSVEYKLDQLLTTKQLSADAHSTATALSDDGRQGISVTGIAWLTGVNFSTGSIDVDLRGKNVFQQSFLGIAFHGADSITYDVVYFRPFNFQSTDTLRRKHAVQYMSEPDYSWDRLRKEHPLVYENAVTPQLTPTGWFHAHIVVTNDEVIVYVNHSVVASLTVKKLNNRDNGMIGLWNDSLPGDFANLIISQ